MMEKEVIYLKDEKVELDPSKFLFTEATLNDYIEHEGGWIDYFGAKLAQAERELAEAEHEYDVLYSRKFTELKDTGGSDKYVEAATKADTNVDDSKRSVIDKKYHVKRLQSHLRAWDKNHENAQSRGHFLRKEMDKLNKDIRCSVDNYYENKINEIVKEVDVDIRQKLSDNMLSDGD